MLALRPPTQDLEAETNTGSLPDRLINPGEYEPLLPTTEQHTAAGTTVSNDLVNKERRRSINLLSLDPGRVAWVRGYNLLYTYDSI